MRRGLILAGLMALLLAGDPIAAAAGSAPGIVCLATGYDVTLHNDSEVAIEAGTEVEWRVPFTRTTGTHTLRATLEPGARINLTGAMGSDYLVGDSPCEVALASETENG
jgi:hypothetical protein